MVKKYLVLSLCLLSAGVVIGSTAIIAADTMSSQLCWNIVSYLHNKPSYTFSDYLLAHEAEKSDCPVNMQSVIAGVKYGTVSQTTFVE